MTIRKVLILVSLILGILACARIDGSTKCAESRTTETNFVQVYDAEIGETIYVSLENYAK